MKLKLAKFCVITVMMISGIATAQTINFQKKEASKKDVSYAMSVGACLGLIQGAKKNYTDSTFIEFYNSDVKNMAMQQLQNNNIAEKYNNLLSIHIKCIKGAAGDDVKIVHCDEDWTEIERTFFEAVKNARSWIVHAKNISKLKTFTVSACKGEEITEAAIIDTFNEK